MDVSKNNGTPKSSILIGFSLINHPFWGNYHYFWKHPYRWFVTSPKIAREFKDSKLFFSLKWWLSNCDSSGWPLVGNEGMKPYMVMMGFHSLIPYESGQPVFRGIVISCREENFQDPCCFCWLGVFYIPVNSSRWKLITWNGFPLFERPLNIDGRKFDK